LNLFIEAPTSKPNKRKYNRKSKSNLSDKNRPSKRTRSKISDLADEFLENESDAND
jgi:hypothetical protein